MQYVVYSTRGVFSWLIKHSASPRALSATRPLLSCCKSRTALRARINYYLADNNYYDIVKNLIYKLSIKPKELVKKIKWYDNSLCMLMWDPTHLKIVVSQYTIHFIHIVIYCLPTSMQLYSFDIQTFECLQNKQKYLLLCLMWWYDIISYKFEEI